VTEIALWKPFGVLSKFTDADGRRTLADLIDLPDVYGAGRLDRDSEGLLVLSDDPKLRGQLTDPDHHVPRTYWAQVEGIPDDAALAMLAGGVEVKGRTTRPCTAQLLTPPPPLGPRDPPIRVRKSIPDSWLELTLTEGRNRQVRRMTAAVGHPTLRLVRSSVGPITLAGLEDGAWRELDADESAALRAALRGGPAAGRPRRPR